MTVASPRSRANNPSYPSIGLPEALERATVLYGEAHRRRLTRMEIARLLGYGSLNGASVTLLSNLTKYGLLEGRGDSVRLAEDAVTVIVEPQGSPDRAAALRRIALQPDLFRELVSDFEGSDLPGENALRIRLERRGFTPAAAQAASRAFLETMHLVTSGSGAYNPSQVAQVEDDRGGSMQAQPTTTTPAPAPATVQSVAVMPPPAQGFKQDVFSLSEGDVVLRWPEGLTKESYEDLKDWLDIMQKKIARSAGVKPGKAQEK